MTTTQLHITGMHCASCKALIEDVAKDYSGVQKCDVDFANGMAMVTHEDGMNMSGLINEIQQLDDAYRVEIV